MDTLEETIQDFLKAIEELGVGTYKIEIDKEDFYQVAPNIYIDRSGHGYADEAYRINSFTMRDIEGNYLFTFCDSYDVVKYLVEDRNDISIDQWEQLEYIAEEHHFTTY